MKKHIALALSLIMALCQAAFADGELKGLSVSQLLTLRSSIDAELMSRGEKDPFTVPMGTYIVGEDLPAGTYKVTNGCGASKYFATLATYMTDANISDFDFINLYAISITTGAPEVGKLKLDDGMAIVIEGSSLMFYQYTGLGLNSPQGESFSELDAEFDASMKSIEANNSLLALIDEYLALSEETEDAKDTSGGK